MKFILLTFLLTPFISFAETKPFKDLEDQVCHPLQVLEGRKANVLYFTTIDCPIANGYSKRFNDLYIKYSKLGFDFFLVHVDSDTTKGFANIHREAYNLKTRILLDTEHDLVKKTEATTTPEVAVILPDGRIAYRGRIDNWYEGFGKKRNVVTKHELVDALMAIHQNKDVLIKRTKAVGCSIPDISK